MKRWVLAVSVVLVVAACTDSDGGESTTTVVAAPAATSPANTTTTTTVAPTSTTAASSTDPGLAIGQATYVLRAVGDVQSVAPNGSVMVVADGDQVCVQRLDVLGVDCLPSPPEFRSRPRLVGGWASDGSRFVFHDSASTAITFRSTVWTLDTVESTLEALLDDPDIIVFDVAVAPEGDTIAVRGHTADRGSGVFTMSNGHDPEPLADVALGDNLFWLPDGTALLYNEFGEEAAVWRIDANDGTVDILASTERWSSLVAVSNDGSWALLYDRELAGDRSVNHSHYEIMRLNTGEVSPLKVETNGSFLGPVFAAFSPDGTQVAYLYHDGDSDDAPLVLAIRPSGGGEAQIISRDLFQVVGTPPTPHLLRQVETDLRAVWTVDDRLVFPTAGWSLVIDLK